MPRQRKGASAGVVGLCLVVSSLACPSVVAPGSSDARSLASRWATAPVASVTDRELVRSARRSLAARDEPGGWSALGNALMQRNRETEQTRDLQAAETAYREALRLDSGSADALVGLAWVHGVEHEFSASIAWAERALAIDPDHVAAHGVLGDAALELGDLSRAATHYQAMLDRRPDLASYSRAAQLLDRQGRHAEAQLLMRRAIVAGGTAPEHVAWCRAQLALMLWRRGALTEAEQVLEQAVADTPDHTDVLLAAGTLHAARGDYDAAIASYERVVERASLPTALASLGDLYALTGRDRLAQSSYDRAAAAFAAHGGHGAHRVAGDITRARFLADRERELDQALAEAEAAYRARATPRAADTLAWVLHKLGRHEEAARYLGLALESGPREAELLFHAGLIHLGLGDHAAARQYLQEALRVNPGFHPLQARVAAQRLRDLAAHADRGPPCSPAVAGC